MITHLIKVLVAVAAMLVLSSCDNGSMGVQIIELDSKTYLVDNSFGSDSAVYLVNGAEISKLDEKPSEYLQVSFDDVRGTSVLEMELIVYGDTYYWSGRIAPSAELIGKETDGDLSALELWRQNIKKEGNFVNLAIAHTGSDIIYAEVRLSISQFYTRVLGSNGEMNSYSGNGSGFIAIDHDLVKLRNTTTNALSLNVSYVLDIEED